MFCNHQIWVIRVCLTHLKHTVIMWINPEDAMLSEVSQAQKPTHQVLLLSEKLISNWENGGYKVSTEAMGMKLKSGMSKTGEMAQQLRKLLLQEDLGSLPGTHMTVNNHLLPSPGLYRDSTSHTWYTHRHVSSIHTCKIKINNSLRKVRQKEWRQESRLESEAQRLPTQ